MSSERTEVFGLCGAGKTTLARELVRGAKGPSSSGLPIRIEGPVVPGGWRAAFETTLVVGRYGLRDPIGCQRLLRDPAGRWLLFKLGYRIAGLWVRGDLSETLLVDSGVIQPLVSFDIEHNFRGIEWDPRPLLRGLPLPARAVYVRVRPSVALERYMQRERSSGRGVSEDGIWERFNRAFRTAERVYEACVDLGVRCLSYENEKPVSAGAKREFAAKVTGTTEDGS